MKVNMGTYTIGSEFKPHAVYIILQIWHINYDGRCSQCDGLTLEYICNSSESP